MIQISFTNTIEYIYVCVCNEMLIKSYNGFGIFKNIQ